MKYLKITAIVFAVGLLLQIYAHINLMVSYKYEVDDMEINIKTEENISAQEKSKRLERMEQRKAEIIRQQKQTKILFWIFLIGLVIVLYFIFYKNKI